MNQKINSQGGLAFFPETSELKRPVYRKFI